MTGDHVDRERSWDSCFNIDFSYMNGSPAQQHSESVSTMDDTQTRNMAGPVWIVRLCRLRSLRYLVSGRYRSD